MAGLKVAPEPADADYSRELLARNDRHAGAPDEGLQRRCGRWDDRHSARVVNSR